MESALVEKNGEIWRGNLKKSCYTMILHSYALKKRKLYYFIFCPMSPLSIFFLLLYLHTEKYFPIMTLFNFVCVSVMLWKNFEIVFTFNQFMLNKSRACLGTVYIFT